MSRRPGTPSRSLASQERKRLEFQLWSGASRRAPKLSSLASLREVLRPHLLEESDSFIARSWSGQRPPARWRMASTSAQSCRQSTRSASGRAARPSLSRSRTRSASVCQWASRCRTVSRAAGRPRPSSRTAPDRARSHPERLPPEERRNFVGQVPSVFRQSCRSQGGTAGGVVARLGGLLVGQLGYIGKGTSGQLGRGGADAGQGAGRGTPVRVVRRR